MYSEFNNVMKTLETRSVYWELEIGDRYAFDSEKLKELVGPRTKLKGVCNPHNPTGRVMTKEELTAIADIAVDHEIKVFVDELGGHNLRRQEARHPGLPEPGGIGVHLDRVGSVQDLRGRRALPGIPLHHQQGHAHELQETREMHPEGQLHPVTGRGPRHAG